MHFYILQLNGKHSLQASTTLRAETIAKFNWHYRGIWSPFASTNRSQQLFLVSFASSGILTGNISSRNTFFFFCTYPYKFHCQKDQIVVTCTENKIEIFPLTIRQLCKHRRVRLERYLFRCLELRHCTGSKLRKKQTRQRVTTEVYNMLLSILEPLLLAGRSKCSRPAWVLRTKVSYVTQIKRKLQCA